jgi:hypothetical protein
MKVVRPIATCLNKTCSKTLSDALPIQYSWEEGDDLSPLLINFVLKYAI